MKNDRYDAILEIIRTHDITTQSELAYYLKERGFDVTQTTVSRDIKTLKLVKALNRNGEYRYCAPELEKKDMNFEHLRTYSMSILSVENAGNLIVIKTITGAATVIAEAIDALHMANVLGTVSGHNTLFVATRDVESAKKIRIELKEIISNNKTAK